MQTAQGVMVVYALLTAVGGVIGYKKQGSKASLMAGIGSGVLLLVGFALSRSNAPLGFGIAAVVALALGIFFATRIVKKGAKMPAVMILPLSVLALIAFLWAIFAQQSQ